MGGPLDLEFIVAYKIGGLGVKMWSGMAHVSSDWVSKWIGCEGGSGS